MTMFGANIAIIKDGKILLTKREDFEVWCLPGGMSEPGESQAQTAIREAKEETGYDVRLTHLVGIYARLGGGQDIHGALFVGEIIGGTLCPQVEEVIDTGWFTLDNLPHDLFWWHVPQIEDALNGIGGGTATRMLLTPAQQTNNRHELYRLRDESGLTRSEFYHQHFETHGKIIKREV
ncbi:MAG: NUDIX domain-containing protein [Chloroflexi bacterium]|nr:MAG: NUDIX domain-containing protein [Chloroflexota bacterium]